MNGPLSSPTAACPQCAQLLKRITELEALVRDLQERLNQNSSNSSESGWSEKGQKRWLWTAATATVAFFVIHVRRSFEGLQALLGETITGIVCSDRWTAYSNPALAETSGAGLPASRDDRPSGRTSPSAIAGPCRGLNGYRALLSDLTVPLLPIQTTTQG